ncbi:MAG: BON domain-containing protein [Candidatus Binatus sp.]
MSFRAQMANRMKIKEAGFVGLMLVGTIAAGSLFVPYARAQQDIPSSPPAVMTTDRSLTVENDKVQTSADHHYNSPAERANDDLLITEVKSSLAERGISDGYPVEVDCDHGTIQLSGVVASAADARRAQLIALNTNGVVGVKNKLTWR